MLSFVLLIEQRLLVLFSLVESGLLVLFPLILLIEPCLFALFLFVKQCLFALFLFVKQCLFMLFPFILLIIGAMRAITPAEKTDSTLNMTELRNVTGSATSWASPIVGDMSDGCLMARRSELPDATLLTEQSGFSGLLSCSCLCYVMNLMFPGE